MTRKAATYAMKSERPPPWMWGWRI